MKRITVPFARTPYRIFIEPGLLRRMGPLIARLLPGKTSRLFIITVPGVRELWGKTLTATLTEANLNFIFIEMEDGERFKTLATVEKLAVQLLRHHADRSSTVLALGGGVVGDVAGFLASTYMRGICCIQAPTTLLAQVDSSVGGKTAVNLPGGKNLVGSFHQPRGVFVDPEVLTTLPEREFRAGMFEALKYGIIKQAKIFGYIEQQRERILGRNPAALEHVIAESLRVKAQVVAFDERESGLRRILNFGHTIGHALEVETGYSYLLHGEAVAWGMIAAIHIAAATRRLKEQVANHMISAVLALAPLPPISVSGDRVLKRLEADKKTVGGVRHFVLPVRIGQVEVVDDVAPDVVIDAVNELRRLSAD